MKKSLCLVLVLLVLALLLPGCALGENRYSTTIWGAFNTTVTFLAYTPDEGSFQAAATFVQEEMLRYHRIFDQYHTYDGVNNLCQVNALAGQGAVPAEPELIELLERVGTWRETYSDRTNPAMGAVLELWHQAREMGTYVPAQEDLEAAAGHCSWDCLVLDREAGTIAFTDPEMSLDLGAVAKGWAAGQVAQALQEKGYSSFILNAGGNVICADAPLDGRSQWTVGVEDIDGVSVKCRIGLKNAAIVTSGDYQRYYELDGVRYHHLIDPDTLQPGAFLHAVNVVCEDSGLGDFLSTALFLMPVEEGKALVESIPGVEAQWILLDESVVRTEGFQELVEKVPQP